MRKVIERAALALVLTALTVAPTLAESAGFPAALPYDPAADALYLPACDGDLTAPALPAGARVVITGLPVLELYTDSGELPGDEDAPGRLRLVEAGEDGALRISESPIEINLRGNTSRRFPKRSYRVKVTDGLGDKRDLSIAGLRADDDWILNPMYSDTSKLREALAYGLWEQINSCGRVAASSRMAFAEVLLNGEYYGLYGVQERVDRKQVGANKRAGLLYKVTANDRPGVAELLDCDSWERCHGMELAYAGSRVVRPWLPAADYLALLSGEEGPGIARLSLENAADYALWSMLVQARDCHFKNQFIHCVPEGAGYVLYRIPWDLNHTFGDLWSGDSPQTNYVTYEIGRSQPDDALERLLETEAGEELAQRLRERWAELRAGPITEEKLLDRVRELFDALYPAILRDGERWPQCGMGEGNAANTRDIEDYLRATLPRIDRWVGEGLRGNR